MKKLSILIFLSVILLFTGCSQKLEDGILKVDNEYKEKNAKTVETHALGHTNA